MGRYSEIFEKDCMVWLTLSGEDVERQEGKTLSKFSHPNVFRQNHIYLIQIY